MKKYIFLFAILFSLIYTYGQETSEKVNFFKTYFGKEKTEVVSEFITLDKSNPFWEIYGKYEKEVEELNVERISLLNDYVENYMTLDEEKANDLVARMQNQKVSLENLINKYYEEINDDIDPIIAAQFYQIEIYLLSAIRLKIFENMPFIVDFDLKE